MSEIDASQALAEVEASPGGLEIGAFFDFDGTLIDGFSASHFFQHRFRNGDIDLRELARTMKLGLDAALGTIEFESFMRDSSRGLAGRSDAEQMKVGEQIFEDQIRGMIFEEMRALVSAHQARGHLVVLASSATHYQAEPMAKALGVDHVVCNRMAVGPDGRLTGAMIEPIVWGPGKARAVQALAGELGVDLRRSWFYADGDEDRALMHLVGRPRPVNPGRRLERVAGRRGWPILRLERGKQRRAAEREAERSKEKAGKKKDEAPKKEEEEKDLRARLRSVAPLAAMLPAATAGLAVGLARRDKRAGLNVFLPFYIDTVLAASGVKVDIVRGRKYLREPRPAIFLFNHVNSWDATIAMGLVRTNVTSVGKKEIEKDPFAGRMGKLMDVAFIDRSDTKSAVEALKPIEDLARRGISVVIAPEGTRSADGTLLPFKKGPFRIAMSAGLPIVPIVIRNAMDIADHDGRSLRPGTVDVIVLPPVDVSDWTVEELPERIAEVRQSYLDTLESWPGR